MRLSPFKLSGWPQEGLSTHPGTLSISTRICGTSTILMWRFIAANLGCVRARVCRRAPVCLFLEFHPSAACPPTFPGTVCGTPMNSPVAGYRRQGPVRASFLSAQVTCLMSSSSYQRNGFIAFDIPLLELIRWLIIINTIFFCCCLHLIEHLLLYALVSFKRSIVFWLLWSVKGKWK